MKKGYEILLPNVVLRGKIEVGGLVMKQDPIKKLVFRIRWHLMSERERYSLLWARSRTNWDN